MKDFRSIPPNSLRIDGEPVGEGRCYLVAEIGLNHNGDLALAKSQMQAAKDSGVNAVKFQNYRTEDFILDRTVSLTYTNFGKQIEESQYNLFKRCELSREDLFSLQSYAQSIGISMHSTPTSEEGIALLEELNVGVLKNGSDFLLHLPLIACMARTKIPTVLSTGMATLSEIDDAVQTFYSAGGKELLLLVCTSSYPTQAEDTHLRRIETLRSAFGCPVGFSDHTAGFTAALGAVALGACWIEKHFTSDKQLPGPDHQFSCDPPEMKELVTRIRELEVALGCPNITPTKSESYGREHFRISCVAARDLPKGTQITTDDITFRRPGGGYPPKYAHLLYGMCVAEDMQAGAVFHDQSFDSSLS
jgi:N,N'-diacetyllegionaminate synthase